MVRTLPLGYRRWHDEGMTFTDAIRSRIRDLGGTYDSGARTLDEDLAAIDVGSAPPLLFRDALDYAEPEVFAALAAPGALPREIVTYPTLAWDVTVFTPFRPGTPDHAEWDGTIDDRALVAAGAPPASTVVFLGSSEGWPNHFFVVAEDPDPADPAVYTTDHETYFDEVEHRGSLSELLDEFFTDSELDEEVAEALASLGDR